MLFLTKIILTFAAENLFTYIILLTLLIKKSKLMKKIFTLVAMAMLAVGANAQKLIAEMDWTTQDAFTYWCSGENESTATVGAEGLEINVPAEGENNWNPQTVILNIDGEKIDENPDAPAILEEDGLYKVVITCKHPAGHLQVNLGTWDDGVSLQDEWDVEAADDFYDFEYEMEGWPANCYSGVHVLWQSGKLVGKSVIKKVQVWRMEDEGGDIDPEPAPEPAGDGVIAEIDWTTQDAFTYWCSGENESTATVGAEGLEINVPAEGENNWNPQTVVLNIDGEKIDENPDAPAILEEDELYTVVITCKHPAGHLQVNLGSWDDGVSLQNEWDVEAKDDFYDFVYELEGWPANCYSGVHVLWQSGKLVGKSVIKKVQVLKAGATGIKNVKANKAANGARYNLAGQKVDASYKGIVIQNGKKFIQK